MSKKPPVEEKPVEATTTLGYAGIWVSVTKPPDSSRDILMCLQNRNQPTLRKVRPGFRTERNTWCEFNGTIHPQWEVAGWMEMPPAPEGEIK